MPEYEVKGDLQVKYADIDRIYQDVPLDAIPWNSETPPYALVEMAGSKKVRPCRTIDLGCGAGNYAIYLAGNGFEVTGVDSSPTAVAIAREHARKKGVRCSFIVADLLGICMKYPKHLISSLEGKCCTIYFP